MTQDIFSSTTSVSEERTERAQRAVRAFRAMQPGLTGYARAITGNRRVVVELSEGIPRTDGKKIYFKPPIALGDPQQHERGNCERRDRVTALQICPACRVREEVLISIYHEIAHIVFGTFQKVTERQKVLAVERAIEEVGNKHAARIKAAWDNVPDWKKEDYMNLSSLISPFLPTLVNVLEDARVDESMFKARKGTRVMFNAFAQNVFAKGIEADDGTIVSWKDKPLNSQAIIGIFTLACGYKYEGWFHPDVEAALGDTKIRELVSRVDTLRSAEGSYSLAFPILARLRELGFCRPPEEEDEQPEDQPQSQENQDGQDDTQDDESDTGEGSDDGSVGDGEGDPEAGEDSSADSSGDDAGSDAGDDEGDAPSDDDSRSDGGSSAGSPDGDGGEDASDSDEDAAGDGGAREDESDPGDGSDGDDDGEGSADSDPSGAPGAGSERGELTDDEEGSGDGEGQPGALDGDDDAAGGDADDDLDGDAGEYADDVIDSGADEGKGGIEADRPEYGTADDVSRDLKVFGHDEEPPARTSADFADDDALNRAIIQGQYFETSSVNVRGVREHKYGVPVVEDGLNMSSGWEDSYGLDPTYLRRYGVQTDLVIPESILGPSLIEMRRTFSDNARAKHERHLRSGKINQRVLGKRAWAGDDRLFQKKRLPGKRSYAVLIGIDISGSTVGVNLALAKRAAMAQAELCHRVGIDFAVYAHTAARSATSYNELNLDVYEVKAFNSPWDSKAKEAFNALSSDSENLDGHTIEYYRKMIERHPATDQIILYYSDGKMPAANHDEELEILRREIAYCKARSITLLGVGIRTDSPRRHGLDTVQVDDDSSIPKVVRHLQSALLHHR